MKKILVTIPTRDKPKQLKRVLKMVYNTCKNRDNFDVQVIIDNDQIDLYKKVTDKYNSDNLICSFPKHLEGDLNWRNIIRSQHNVLEENSDYYFIFFMPDDLFGLTISWDKCILDKIKTFDDDIFAMYTDCMLHGRDPSIHKKCYTYDPRFKKYNYNKKLIKKKIPLYKDTIARYHEMMSIWTSKLENFIYPLFYPPYNYRGSERGFMVPGIIKFLYEEHEENRNVFCDMSYSEITYDSKGRSKEMYPEWSKLQNRGYDDLKEIAKKIKEHIDEYRVNNET